MEIKQIKEISRQVTPIMVNGLCPNCEGGILSAAGDVEPIRNENELPRWPHRCDKCNEVFFIVGQSYPYINWHITAEEGDDKE
jgi:hypothetical protein